MGDNGMNARVNDAIPPVALNRFNDAETRALAFARQSRLDAKWTEGFGGAYFPTWHENGGAAIPVTSTPSGRLRIASVLSYVRARMNDGDETFAFVSFCSNMLFPNVLFTMSEDEMNVAIVSMARALWNMKTTHPLGRYQANYYDNALVQADEDAARPGGILAPYRAHLPANSNAPWEAAHNNVPAARMYIVWYAFVIIRDEYLVFARRCYIALYVAFSKRGVIRQEKMASICNQISTELGTDVEPLDTETIAKIWAAASEVCKQPAHFLEVFAAFERETELISLRLKLTVAQAAGSGLTCYNMIRAAMTAFPGFNWPKLCAMIPADMAAFTRALEAIGNDQYYAFGREMGDFAASKYKTLSYAAKLLLVKYGGSEYAGLRNYKGITKTPARKEEIDRMIEAFEGAPLDPAVARIQYEALRGHIRDLPEFDEARVADDVRP